MNEEQNLKELVKEFFDRYLDVKEESDSGGEFYQIQISNCRALTLAPLGELLKKMRTLSGAGKNE